MAWFWRSAVLLAVAAAQSASGQFALAETSSQARDIVVGQSLDIPSRSLGRSVRISVGLPASYRCAKRHYGVLYTFQGSVRPVSGIVESLASAGQAPELIVVSVDGYWSGESASTEGSGEPDSGRADRLLRFLGDELIPYIDSHYRTAPHRIAYSGSTSGAFCVYALLSAPWVFNAVIAASPSPGQEWDCDNLLRQAEILLARQSFANHFLYMGVEDSRETPAVLSQFVETLNRVAPDGLICQRQTPTGEDAASIPHRTLIDGLLALYRPWRAFPDEVAIAGADGIFAYERELEGTFGFDIGLSQSTIWIAMVQALNDRQYDQAIALGKMFVDHYPLPTSYRALGRAYEATGQHDQALQAFSRALDLAIRTDSPFLSDVRADVERVRQRVVQPR